jgi:serine/threonine protein kinase
MNEPVTQGVCPSCEQEGEVGRPCAEVVCSRRGYHFIPLAYVDSEETMQRDSLIGRPIGGYLPVDLLGTGGFGRVYLALQRAMLAKKAAVKLLHVQEEAAVLELVLRKFRSEAEALAVINHPNVVQFLEYGTHDGSPYLVMEFVEGARTLGDEIQRKALHGDGFSTDEIRSVVAQIVNGLEAAHTRGVIHRDIKPENLMLQDVAGNPLFVRLVDFGLARFTEAGTCTSKAMGTPRYMAPEQLHMQQTGPWTDLYALGVVAFEMLTGRGPFPGRTNQEIIVKKIDHDYDPLTPVRDLHLPSEVERFLRRALARDRENRYQSCSQFRAGFAEACVALQMGGVSDRTEAPLTQSCPDDPPDHLRGKEEPTEGGTPRGEALAERDASRGPIKVGVDGLERARAELERLRWQRRRVDRREDDR